MEKSFCDSQELATKIINYYPIYGSDGQRKSQEILEQYLSNNNWKTFFDTYSYCDYENNILTRKPWEYDNFYDNYKDVIKNNLYAILDSGKPGNTLILNGHIDVDIINKECLYKSFSKAYVKDNCLYGRGATDMISGLCCLAVTNNYLETINWSGRVIFTSVVDEEIGGNGSIRACEWLKENQFINSKFKIECVIAEPTENEVCNCSMGFLPFKFRLNANDGHMNTISEDENIISRLAYLIKYFDHLKNSFSDLFINIGHIKGGEDAGLPISSLELEGVIAMAPELNIDETKKYISEACKDCEVFFPNLIIEPMQSIRSTFGKMDTVNLPERKLFKSSCDAPIFDYFGIPTVIFGPGSLKQAHTSNEFIHLDSAKEYIRKYFENLEKFLGE